MKWMQSFWEKIRSRLPALIMLLITLFLIWAAFGKSFRSLLPLIRRGDREAIVTYLSGEDEISGMISVLLLSALQLASIIMPGMAIHIAAGALYNWWKAFLLCYTGFIIGNMAVYWFAKNLSKGDPLNLKLGSFGMKVMELLKNTPTMFLVIVVFMIPGIPNGIVPYIAVQRKMKMGRYFIGTAVGSWIQILAACMVGDFLVRGSIMYGVIVFCVQWVVLAAVIWKRDLLMKWSG